MNMSESKFNPRSIILLAIIIFVSIIRIAAPLSGDFKVMANFSAVGAIALFGGAYFNNNVKAFSFPILILILSDLIIAKSSGYGFFYAGWYWTYIAFLAMVGVSKLIMKKVNVGTFVASTLIGVILHWILSDIGPMYAPSIYPATLAGYGQCLINAIPFELNFLYGTVAYGAVMFGAFETLKVKYPALSLVKSA